MLMPLSKVPTANGQAPAAKTVTGQQRRALRKLLRAYPVGRIGVPADAAALITFLASDAAAWITAQTYPVNGGYSAAL